MHDHSIIADYKKEAGQRHKGPKNQCREFQIKPSMKLRDGCEQCILAGDLNEFDTLPVSLYQLS